MLSYNVHEAKTQFSKLLSYVLEGQRVLITRNGVPVAELVPARKRRFPLGAGRNDPDINKAALRNEDWWRAMTDQEVDRFLEGRHECTCWIRTRWFGASVNLRRFHHECGRSLRGVA